MGRVALVTGGTRGIGEAISIALQAAGYRVAGNYGRNDEAAQAFTARTAIPAYKFDVGSYDAVAAGIAQIEQDIGPLEVLVNNAGITRDGSLHKMSPEQWTQVLQTNLGSCFNTCRAVIAGMRERGFGRIVNIGSINGQMGQFGQVIGARGRSQGNHGEPGRPWLCRHRDGAGRPPPRCWRRSSPASRRVVSAGLRTLLVWYCFSWRTRRTSSPGPPSQLTADSTCTDGLEEVRCRDAPPSADPLGAAPTGQSRVPCRRPCNAPVFVRCARLVAATISTFRACPARETRQVWCRNSSLERSSTLRYLSPASPDTRTDQAGTGHDSPELLTHWFPANPYAPHAPGRLFPQADAGDTADSR
jgi:NAD(P)-dependent dehydrogenase (short-subunit alcohol dehydrogenase family)